MNYKAEILYPLDTLESFLSVNTLDNHYNKHHIGYARMLLKLLEDDKNKIFRTMPLEHIVSESTGELYDMAAQVLNHNIYWKSMSPQRLEIPTALEEEISNSFGSVEMARKFFLTSAESIFGSGWLWLIMDSQGKLEFMQGKNAENPLSLGLSPLMTCDVWEHAYYLDYQSDRSMYLEKFWNHIDWNFVEKNWVSRKELT